MAANSDYGQLAALGGAPARTRRQAVYARARRLGYTVGADFSLVDMPKGTRKRVRALSEDEQLTLIRNAHKSFYGDFFLALLFTGCRVGELIALEWRDVNLRAGFFRITQTAYKRDTQSPKTAESLRNLPINNEFYTILLRNFARQGRVFRNTLGQIIIYRSVWTLGTAFLSFPALSPWEYTYYATLVLQSY